MRRLSRLIDLRERTCRADKAFTPHPPVAGAVAGCNACRVLSGQEDCTLGRIRRLRRIRQQLQIIAYGKIVIQHKQMRGTPGEIRCPFCAPVSGL